MILKNFDLVKTVNGLISLQKECDIPFTVLTAHKINRNIKKLLDEAQPYEEDRQKIMDENISDSEKLTPKLRSNSLFFSIKSKSQAICS